MGYTAKKQPWQLVYCEGFEDKTEALKRENFLKRQKSKDFILRLVWGSSDSS
jgi:putative endonuclease